MFNNKKGWVMKLGDKVTVCFEGVVTEMKRMGWDDNLGDFAFVKSTDNLPGGVSVATVNMIYVKPADVSGCVKNLM